MTMGTQAPPARVSGGGNSFASMRTSLSNASEPTVDQAPQSEGRMTVMTEKERKAAEKAARQLKGSFEDYPHLLAMKPREGYVFRSDYFNLDDGVACVLGFFHDEGSQEDFGAFWGINRIPTGLGEGVTVVLFEQVRRRGQRWIDDHMSTSEKITNLANSEQASGGSSLGRRKAAKLGTDLEIASAEIQDGASYLHVHNRILVKTSSLEKLDEALDRIRRLYVERFGTVNIAAYPGLQRRELSTLFRTNDKKRGKGEGFTSVEFAGAHSLVTNGLNDPDGEYVGTMLGDVNNSAVLFNVNGYEHHLVVADSTMNTRLGRAHVPDLWGSKISQAALLNNARVVHLVLDGADLDRLGPKLSNITARLDMSSGDINMFEMFGDREDELAIFPAHLDKIVLMAEQAYETTDDDRSIIRGSLKETLTTFYIDKGMWARNAGQNRDRLRLVNLDHRHVPRLQDLVTYFETQYKALANSSARDDEALHAQNVLRLVFKDMLDNNTSLFNTYTNDEIDGVHQARRVVYDFSKLTQRGVGVAMAQLVNVVGFAVSNLGLGDTVIVHGAEHIDERVKSYVQSQFDRLFVRGGRVAYLYNEVDAMLADSKFNRFDRADYTVLGPMTDGTVAEYQKQLGQDIPPDLERLVTQKGGNFAYLRRGVSNVVFTTELSLGVDPKRAAHRERIAREQQAADKRRRMGRTGSERHKNGVSTR